MIKNKMFYEILPNVPIFLNFERKVTCKIISKSIYFSETHEFLKGKWKLKITQLSLGEYFLIKERLTDFYKKPEPTILKPKFKLEDLQ